MTVQKEKITRRRIVCRKCKSDQLVGNKRVFNSVSYVSSTYSWIYYAPMGTNNFIQWIYW